MRYIDYDYKAEFIEAVNDLIAEDIEDRVERMYAVYGLIEAYVDSVGKWPDKAQLNRLEDYILREELRDMHPDKMSREEYPFMSDYQLSRRRYGAHKGKTALSRTEVPLSSVMNLGIDGINYEYPKRRRRTIEEMIYMDEVTKSRNKDRRRKYSRFRSGKSKGVFAIDISSGEKIIHDKKTHDEIYFV